MTCRHLESDLVDLARGVANGGDLERTLREHLETCAACAARFERERRLSAGLRALAAATPVPANEAAQRQVVEAFAAFGPAPLSSRTAAQPGGPWALAAAACVLMVLGGLAATWWRTGPTAPQTAGAATTVPASLPEPASPPERVTSRPLETAAVPARASSPRRGPGTSVQRAALGASRQSDSGRLEDFVALPAADGLPGFDSGMIVRVAIPTASLPAFGFAIGPGAARTTDADVLVGQDGQARAIRLVGLADGSRRER